MSRFVLVICLLSPSWLSAQEQVQPELELVREAKFSQLLGERADYEASGVALAGDQLYVVFDDDGRIARVNLDLDQAELLPGEDGEEYEGITWDARRERFYVSIEAQPRADGEEGARPAVLELDRDLQSIARHEVPFDLDGANKGAEGVALLPHERVTCLLLLLEGNHGVGGRRGREVGNGRVLVLRLEHEGFQLVSTLELPQTAAFEDYAGIAIRGKQLAVVSQSSAQLWVGTLDTKTWSVDEGRVFAFPLTDGEIAYGNIEGVVWLDDQTLACVSDQPKATHPEHLPKGESIHVFRLPE